MGGSGVAVVPPVRFCACPVCPRAWLCAWLCAWACVWLCGAGRCVVAGRADVGRAVVWGRVPDWGCGLVWVDGRFVGRRDVDIAGFSIGSIAARAGVVVSRARHAHASIRPSPVCVHMPLGYIPSGRMADARTRAGWYTLLG